MRHTITADQLRLFVRHTLNLLSICFATFALVGIVRHHATASAVAPPATLTLGQRIVLDEVDWSKEPKTVLFLLAPETLKDRSSLAFLQTLRNERREDWQGVLASPIPAAIAKASASEAGLEGWLVTSVSSIAALGLSQMPAVLLIDKNGRLLQQWLGELGTADRIDLATHLGVPASAITGSATEVADGMLGGMRLVLTSDLVGTLSRSDATLLDVRSREVFASSHLVGARNIPAGELKVRAPHEIDSDKPVVMYCNFEAGCVAAGQPTICSQASDQLRDLGVADVRVIRDSLPLLRQAGLKTERVEPVSLPSWPTAAR